MRQAAFAVFFFRVSSKKRRPGRKRKRIPEPNGADVGNADKPVPGVKGLKPFRGGAGGEEPTAKGAKERIHPERRSPAKNVKNASPAGSFRQKERRDRYRE